MTDDVRLTRIAVFANASQMAAQQGAGALEDIFHALDAIYMLATKSNGFLTANERPLADRLADVERWSQKAAKPANELLSPEEQRDMKTAAAAYVDQYTPEPGTNPVKVRTTRRKL